MKKTWTCGIVIVFRIDAHKFIFASLDLVIQAHVFVIHFKVKVHLE